MTYCRSAGRQSWTRQFLPDSQVSHRTLCPLLCIVWSQDIPTRQGNSLESCCLKKRQKCGIRPKLYFKLYNVTVLLLQYDLSLNLNLFYSLSSLEWTKIICLTASFLVAVVSTVVELVTNPTLEDTTTTCARKLISIAARVI